MWHRNTDKQGELYSALGRFVICKVQVDDKMYVLANIYAPNKDKDLVLFLRNCTLCFKLKI